MDTIRRDSGEIVHYHNPEHMKAANVRPAPHVSTEVPSRFSVQLFDLKPCNNSDGVLPMTLIKTLKPMAKLMAHIKACIWGRGGDTE